MTCEEIGISPKTAREILDAILEAFPSLGDDDEEVDGADLVHELSNLIYTHRGDR